MRISALKAPAFLAAWVLACDSLLAPTVATSSKDAAATTLFKRLAKSQTHESVLGPGFASLDTNDDGFLSVDELEAGQLMTWSNLDAAKRARKVFGIPSLEEFVELHDTDGDGLLSRDELRPTLDQLPSDQDQCLALKSKLDSCAHHPSLVKYSAYVKTAEALCRTGHENVVQQCIMSSDCDNIGKCIKRAEKSVHDEALMVVQPPSGQPYAVTGYSNTTTALTVPHEKRGLFLLGFLIVAIITAVEITLVELEQMAQNIVISSVNEARFMDFKYWNGQGSPPACTVYMFWSNSCGAILSHSARTCSNGGTRLYGNSCKDHFRYGSRGCGFLDLGCQSLCYGVNEQGCPCSYFSYQQQNDVDYPGGDLRGFHVDVTSDCRSACAGDATCLAFETLPPNGDKNQDNCLLKNALGSPQTSKGVTTFVKLGHTNQCSPASGSSDWDFFSKRDVIESVNDTSLALSETGDEASRNPLKFVRALVARASGGPPPGPFPFDATTTATYTIIATFLRAIYGIGNPPWLNMEQINDNYAPVVNTPIGDDTLRYVPPTQGTGPRQLANTVNPRWAAGEAIWRVLNAFRSVVYTAQSSTTPVTTFINNQPTDQLGTALFPADFRTLLINNENALIASGQDWQGRSGGATTAGTQAAPGVNIAHAGPSGLRYYQTGAAGPFSIEGAFLLASQVAGINWRTVLSRQAAAGRSRPQPYYLGVLRPPAQNEGNGGQCITGQRYDSSGNVVGTSQLGLAVRPTSSNRQGDGRSGYYIAMEIDFDRAAAGDENRNLFVFVVHAIDPNSVVQIPNPSVLTNLRLTAYPPPPPDASSYEDQRYAPGAPGMPPAGPSNANAGRILAHGHATLVSWANLNAFFEQDPNGQLTSFPGYSQVGYLHFYIQSEDESNVWPRANYRNQDNGGSGGHDEL